MIRHPIFKYIFIFIDTTALSVSFFGSLTINVKGFWWFSEHYPYYYASYFFLYLSLMAIFLSCMRFNNLYRRNIIIGSRHYHLIQVIKAMMAGSIISILFMVITNVTFFSLIGKSLLFSFIGYSCLFLLLRVMVARKLFYFLAKHKIYNQRILVVGGDETGKRVAELLINDPFQDFSILGFLDDYKPLNTPIYDRFKNLGNLDDIEDVVEELHVDEIIIAIDHLPYKRLIFIVEKCIKTGKLVRIYSDLVRIITSKLNVEIYSRIPLVEFSQYSLTDPFLRLKRIIDVVVSGAAILVFFPLFIIVAAGIKLSSRGPVFYIQRRIGKNGKEFNFYKFRSMHVHADTDRHKQYVKQYIKGKLNHDSNNIYKITEDDRIFEFGKFIRKLSIDELPQLFNVLKGDMSLVGPRPCLPYEWEEYDDWHKERIKILPGCTGLWQVLGRSSVTFEEMVIMDLYYISNMTPWLDFMIILKTIPAMLYGEGAY